MKHVESIAKPVVVAVLICTFLYVYFIYLKGDNVVSLVRPPAQTENEWEDVPPRDPAVVPLAGPAVQEQNPVVPETPLPIPSANWAGVPPVQPDPTAPRQPLVVPDVNLQEGHWIGLEVIPLTAAIAHANNIPPNVTGVLVDEVTLLSAEAGLYAGDVITAINGRKTGDLKSFRLATKEVAQANRATVSVFSGGKEKNLTISSAEPLGIAQMEAAPMILATDRSPHGYYGPCDKCHAISRTALNSNQMAKDQGDSLTKVAPNIRAGTRPPHRNRGTCTKCHVVL